MSLSRYAKNVQREVMKIVLIALLLVLTIALCILAVSSFLAWLEMKQYEGMNEIDPSDR